MYLIFVGSFAIAPSHFFSLFLLTSKDLSRNLEPVLRLQFSSEKTFIVLEIMWDCVNMVKTGIDMEGRMDKKIGLEGVALIQGQAIKDKKFQFAAESQLVKGS